MRTIKFRGLSISGQWITGSLFNWKKYGKDILIIGEGMQNGSVNGFEVDPETVGQFTGFTTKKGEAIYEGMKVKAVAKNSSLGEQGDIYQVEYSDKFCQFVLRIIFSNNKNRIGNIALKGNNQPYLINNVTEVIN